MKTFYVSLTKDLLGVYLAFEADSKECVRAYLADVYFDAGANVWTLPWCSVYVQEQMIEIPNERPVIIKSNKKIYNDDYFVEGTKREVTF